VVSMLAGRNPSGAALPPDIDGSKQVSGGDLFAIFSFWLTSTARYDLDAGRSVSGGDAFNIFPWSLNTCH